MIKSRKVLIGVLLCLLVACSSNQTQRFPASDADPSSPDYFENKLSSIMVNDGEKIVVRMGIFKGILGYEKYNIKYNILSPTGKNIKTGVINVKEDPNVSVDINKTGKYKFIFRLFALDKLGLITGYKRDWEIDVFVIKKGHIKASKEEIFKIAKKYSPISLMHDEEEYLPSSISYIMNRVDIDEELAEEKFEFSLDTGYHKDDSLWKRIFNYPTSLLPNSRDKSIIFPYKDIEKILPYFGDADSVCKNADIENGGKSTEETRLRQRFGTADDTTIYYSYFENNERGEAYLHYHYLYAFDPKTSTKEKFSSFSHIFDRESVSIILDLKTKKPKFLIYGAHLASQPMGIIDIDDKNIQRWQGGRVKVKWSDIPDIDGHPIVSIAKGSHALYPVPSNYAVYLKKHKITLNEPAGGKRIIVPEIFDVDEVKGYQFYQYKLKDLELGNITSNGWNKILSYSGNIVDVLGRGNAKWPPFTAREFEVNKYMDQKVIYNFDMDKIPEESKILYEEIIDTLEKVLD